MRRRRLLLLLLRICMNHNQSRFVNHCGHPHSLNHGHSHTAQSPLLIPPLLIPPLLIPPLLRWASMHGPVHTLRHKHELESGRTSSLARATLGYDPQGQVLNYQGCKALTQREIALAAATVCAATCSTLRCMCCEALCWGALRCICIGDVGNVGDIGVALQLQTVVSGCQFCGPWWPPAVPQDGAVWADMRRPALHDAVLQCARWTWGGGGNPPGCGAGAPGTYGTTFPWVLCVERSCEGIDASLGAHAKSTPPQLPLILVLTKVDGMDEAALLDAQQSMRYEPHRCNPLTTYTLPLHPLLPC